MKTSTWELPPLLAWMQPGASRRKQILTSVYVPLQPDNPSGLVTQLLDQQAGKIYSLLRKAEEEYGEDARAELVGRLLDLGFLPEDYGEMSNRELVLQLTEPSQEIRVYLRPEIERGQKVLTEIPGAKELMESLTLTEWLDALEAEVNGD